ncbi:uncharacterized protein MONBRDRAFT_12210 [Monosiga brevicollis MX1]|uniref:Uncharacterized protein n=1 Tax=Monosiga brevicollis TaxID=81824 RepID=A9VBJ6_MONBE|nr:uncharacterized protein MONBRDRAFT_12210 [Monosiga brevicollis MX1]EDQ85074.1 predicted protein [Monosiga brevicollis MX1]|eukprot:XP_001750078.1 hypothetical protein [Monosiga brevicollis MX1]
MVGDGIDSTKQRSPPTRGTPTSPGATPRSPHTPHRSPLRKHTALTRTPMRGSAGLTAHRNANETRVPLPYPSSPSPAITRPESTSPRNGITLDRLLEPSRRGAALVELQAPTRRRRPSDEMGPVEARLQRLQTALADLQRTTKEQQDTVNQQQDVIGQIKRDFDNRLQQQVQQVLLSDQGPEDLSNTTSPRSSTLQAPSPRTPSSSHRMSDARSLRSESQTEDDASETVELPGARRTPVFKSPSPHRVTRREAIASPTVRFSAV